MPMTFEIVCQTDENVTAIGVKHNWNKPCVAGYYSDMFRVGLIDGEDVYAATAKSQGELSKTTIPKTSKATFSVVAAVPKVDAQGYNRLNAKIYANGGAFTEISNSFYIYTNPYILIGQGYGFQGAISWEGKIYSVRIYNRELSQDELDHNYLVDRARFNF